MPESCYIHGTTSEEQRRLTLMNDLINEACLRELALAEGARVLDVGAGLAAFARMMAKVAGPDGAVLGIERELDQIEEAYRLAAEADEGHLVKLRQGDATDLPLEEAEWGTFDVAHARFILEHVPDPFRVVQQMVRAVRPGGRIVLVDDDHDVFRLWPVPPGFQMLWQSYVRSYDRLGNDACVGRRLVSLLHAAGAQPRRNNWIFYGGCAGQDLFEPLITNLVGVLQGAREAVLDNDFMEPTYFDEALDAFQAWSQRPDAAFWYAISWAEGIRSLS